MKLFKKIFVTTLILTTTLCGSTVDGFAKDETHITNEVASESFKTFIEPLYNEAKNIIVYNANNENVTHSFITNTQELYNNNNYKAIEDYIYEYDLLFEKTPISNISSRNMTKAYHRQYKKIVKGTGSRPGIFGNTITEKISICYEISGNATSNNKGQIISYTKPRLSIIGGSDKSYSMTNVSCSATKNGASIKINAKFVPTWSYSIAGYGWSTFTAPEVKESFSFTPIG